jgi:ABC-2 type transport system permease protein
VVVGPGTAALLALVALRAVQDGYAAGPGSYDTWSGAVLANQGPALVGTVTALVLGVLMVTSEYSSGSIKVSLSADPRRGQVFGAKVVGIVGVVAAIGVASVAFSLVVVKLVLGSGLIPAELNAEAIKAMIGVVIYLIAVALIGLGMGFALRSSAGAVTLGLGLFFVLDLALQIGASASRVIEIIQELLPVNAGMLLWGGPSASQGAVITGYGSGLGILAAWVVLALGSGYLVLRSRDA